MIQSVKRERAPLENSQVDIHLGLTKNQIQERIEKKYINDIKIGSSKSVLNIIVANTCTFFNLLCFLIFLWILSIVKSFNDLKNGSFMIIILVNIIIGIIQELKAKRMMDQLSLMSSPMVTVLRQGKNCEIHVNEILKDDLMLLSSDKQISADAVIVEGSVEVNESLLTGESDAIIKKMGDMVLSGSFVVSGKCKAQVKHIAEENYVQKLSKEAKQFKRQPSELLHSLTAIIKILTVVILIYAIPTFLNNLNANLMEIGGVTNENNALFYAIAKIGSFTKAQIYEAYVLSVTPTSTALIGMIPAGLFLLTSVALAVGVIRLAKQNALVQGLYSIETLARVNLLCLDKTGTITDGTMKVNAVIPLTNVYSTQQIGETIKAMELALEDTNSTAQALKDYFTKGTSKAVDYIVPFSSDRKCSMVKFSQDSLYMIGAPEYVMQNIPKSLSIRMEAYQKQGFRCLLLCTSKDEKAVKAKRLPIDVEAIAFIVLEDNIKKDAIATIQYFKENDVDVRVISGDNPITVSQVAKRVGIEQAEKYISLQHMTDEAITKIAMDYSVFGRVNPNQKKLLVQIFKSHDKTVAMTGDGINDILALKEADCSIAMANGSEATRNVAQLVLLDSNFGSMPSIVGEGRRVVNNIQRASTLFLMKTLYTFILQLILIFMQIKMPLDPIQLSFVGMFGVAIPSFVLALEPNNNRIKGNFIINVLKKIIPASIVMVLSVIAVVLLTNNGMVQATEAQQKTMVMLAIFIVYVLVICDISRPINLSRGILIVGILIVTMTLIAISPYLPISELNLFNIAKLNRYDIIATLLALIVSSGVLLSVGKWIVKKLENLWETYHKKLAVESIKDRVK